MNYEKTINKLRIIKKLNRNKLEIQTHRLFLKFKFHLAFYLFLFV